MNIFHSCSLILAFVTGVVSDNSFAASEHQGTARPVSAASAAQDTCLAKAKAEYPLDTCVVSGDKLEGGEMGGPINYLHKVDGKPDRLVRFCCKSCVKDFKKDPALYLKKIDDAAAAKAGIRHPGH